MIDTVLNMNTGNGEAFFTSPKISGELKAIILDSEEPVTIHIESEIGYTLFDRIDHKGKRYIRLKGPSDSQTGNPYTDHVDFFHLNEKLIIKVSGKKSVNIRIILRYSKI